MRHIINEWVHQHPDVYLLHSDTWHLPPAPNIVNCGITEPSMVTLAAGLMAAGKTVVLYGVCGFVLYRGYDQFMYWISNKHYPGNLIFINAGANNCYPEKLGVAHRIYNDIEIAQSLNLTVLEPTYDEVVPLLDMAYRSANTKFFIRLGYDINRANEQGSSKSNPPVLI